MQIKLRIQLALRWQRAGELVQQTTFELAWLDLEFRARRSIDDADRRAGVTNAVAQLGGEIPLNFFAAEILDAWQDALDEHVRTRFGEQCRPVRDAIARVTLAQMHLVGASIVACTGQQQVFAQRPETQQTDAELALQPSLSVRLHVSLDRIV